MDSKNPPPLQTATSPMLPTSNHEAILHHHQQQSSPAPLASNSPDFTFGDSSQQPLFMSQQQQHPSGTLSTPEAHWSASSNLSSAPALTLSSSEGYDQNSIFDSFNRPYTPSYNSASAFEGAFSDQDDLWSGTGSHFEEADFAFGPALTKGQNNLSTLAYDPETADNYNNIDAVLLAASSFGQSNNKSSSTARSGLPSQSVEKGSTGLPSTTVQFADQNNFREVEEKSPITSPLLAATTSPNLHTRHSSFGSHFDPTPALDSEQNWMQSLGQRITLSDDSGMQSRHQLQQQQQQHQQQQRQHHRHTASLQDYSNQNHFAPVFEEDGHSVDHSEQSSQQHFPSYTYSQLQPQSQFYGLKQLEASGSQLPLLSIGDTTMQDAAFSHSRAPDGRNWAESGHWSSTANDYYPLSYSNSTQNIMGHLNNSELPAPTSFSLNRQGNTMQGPQQGKRQDSYDQIRKFLRLDVDMGFVSQQQHHLPESGGLRTARKRSNSDFGPSYFGGVKDEDEVKDSPPLFTVVPGGVTDKTPIALTSGVDWATETARQRKLQAQTQGDMRSDAVVMTMQQNSFTMDPNLLLQQQQQQQQNHNYQTGSFAQQTRYDPASGPMRQRDVSNLRGPSGPYQHDRTLSSSSSSGATPWTPVSPIVPATSAASTNDSSYASLGSSPSQISMRRSQSASRHRRGAQSEDLSQLARSSNPAEFLHRITAPDGSLAPPHSHSSAASIAFASPLISNNSTTSSSSRLNPAYRTSHDRHQSSNSNHSTSSSIGSNEAAEVQERQAAMNRYRSNSAADNAASSRSNQKIYSQTALPTYSTLLNNLGDSTSTQTMTAGTSNGSTSVAFPYPVAQVTTTATQAASASRRKNEAIHICPIPGCGSTFTRKFNLNGHIRSHTGARPYECREPGCGKSFARSFDLSRHEKLHAGIKPHNCESCGKSFARADALSRHLRNDAGNGGCALRFNEEDEDEDGEDENQSQARLLSSVSTPAIRLRSGSSASSSLDSVDEVDRNREGRLLQFSTDSRGGETESTVKRESRFKGYIL